MQPRMLTMSTTAIAEPSARSAPARNWAGDQRAGHVALRATEHGRGDVVTGQRDEHQQQPGHDPRQASGNVTWKNVRTRLAPRSLLGFPQRRVEPVECDEQREDHQRQVVVDDAELHREAGVEQPEVGVAQADVLEPVREEPLGDSTIRHAIVRIRKFVQNGMMTRPSRTPRQLAGTFTARKYATGKPISRHRTVPMIDVRSVCFSTWKNVSTERLAVVVERGMAGVDVARPSPWIL